MQFSYKILTTSDGWIHLTCMCTSHFQLLTFFRLLGSLILVITFPGWEICRCIVATCACARCSSRVSFDMSQGEWLLAQSCVCSVCLPERLLPTILRRHVLQRTGMCKDTESSCPCCASRLATICDSRTCVLALAFVLNIFIFSVFLRFSVKFFVAKKARITNGRSEGSQRIVLER